MATIKLLPSFVEENRCAYDSLDSTHPLSNVLGKDENSETYARWYMTKGGAAVTRIYYGFDFSKIPSDATITKVSCSAKGRIENTSIARGGNNNIALYKSEDVIVRSSLTLFGTTAEIATISTTDFTRDTLNDLRFAFSGSRGLISANTMYYMDLFGCSLTVEYTAPESPETVECHMLKANGIVRYGGKVYRMVAKR